jgi:hypothetical protein
LLRGNLLIEDHRSWLAQRSIDGEADRVREPRWRNLGKNALEESENCGRGEGWSLFEGERTQQRREATEANVSREVSGS